MGLIAPLAPPALAASAQAPPAAPKPLAQAAEPAPPVRWLDPAPPASNSTTAPERPGPPSADQPPKGGGPDEPGAGGKGDPPARGWSEPEESRGDEASAAARAKETGKPVVIEESLSERRAVYANPDGTLTESLTSLPARVRRGNGWAQADPTLVSRGGRVASAATLADVTFSAGGDRLAAELTTSAGERIGFRAAGDLPKPSVQGDQATYANVQPGVDMVWHARVTGAEQSFVVKERPGAAPVFRVPLELPTSVKAEQDGDGVRLVDAKGQPVGYIGGTRTFGASRDPVTDEPVHQVFSVTRLETSRGRSALVIEPPAQFFDDPELVYPVTVDPSITMVYTGADTYVDRSYPNSSYASSTELHVGYYNPGLKRSFITFDTSQLPGKVVTSANLRLYEKYSWSCSARGVTVGNSGGSSSSTTWNNQPVIDAPRDGAASFAKGYSSSCPAGLVYLPVTNLAQFWADQRVGAAAVGIKASNEGDVYGYKKFNSGNDGSYFPEVQVTYSAVPNVPSSLSPGTGTTVTSTTPTLSGYLYDSDSANVEGRFYVKNSSGTLIASPPAAAGITPSGTRLNYGVPSSVGLQPGQTYSWYMQACQSANSCSATTATHTFTVQATTPSAPLNLEAFSDDASARAQWSAPSSDGGSAVLKYGWELKGNDGSTRTGETNSATTLSVSVTGLTNGVSYTFRVWAINARGAGTSATSNSVIPSTVPSTPQNVSAAVVKAASTSTREDVVVSFDRSSPNGSAISRYDVWVYQNGSHLRTDQCPTSGACSGTGRISYTVPSTEVGLAYSFRVRAVNSRGGSPLSAYSNTVTPAMKPEAPTNVTVVEQTGTASPTVTVSWVLGKNGSADLTGHRVRVYDSSGTYLKQVTVCGGCASASVPYLERGKTYTFGVIAQNRVGESPESVRSAPFRVHTPPAITKTLAAARDSLVPAIHRRGETVEYTVTVRNTNSDSVTLGAIKDVLPVDTQAARGSLLLNGALCQGCTIAGQDINLQLGDAANGNAGTLQGGEAATFTYVAVLAGSERACLSAIKNNASVTSVWGGNSESTSATACGGGLGLEPWWSYWSTAVGPQASAAVNVANGNLAVTATDSTPVQGHGRLGYIQRRSYNSQEATAATLPGSLGAGWALNLGHTDDLTGTGVTGTGLIVPRLGDAVAKLTDPLSLTLVDRDGTRHLFSPKVGLPALPAVGQPDELAALQPKTLTAPAGKTVCVDLAYTSPAGVHLGLWRYLAVDGACDTISASSNPVVLGYAAVRPDRLRTEYAATGQLVSLIDGAGNELRYAYEGSGAGLLVDGIVLPGRRLALVYEPSSCTATPDANGNPTVASTCRATRLSYPSGAVAVQDPAGRTTTYALEQITVAGLPAPVQVLKAVTDPAVAAPSGSTTYRYQGDPAASPTLMDCGGSPLQLCSITDQLGGVTSFRYTRDQGALAGLGRLTRVVERPRAEGAAGTATDFSYPSAQTTTAVRGGSQQRSWTGLDAFGRAGQTLDGPVGDPASATYPAAHATLTEWDGAASDGTQRSCEQLAPGQASRGRDNNLCRQVVKGSSNATGAPTPDSEIRSTYDNAGSVLVTRQKDSVVAVTGTDADGRPTYAVRSGTPAELVTTYGYARQHIASSGRSTTGFTVAGSGNVAPQGSQAAGTELYTITDRTEHLPPRGNAAADWSSFRSTWTVDNASGNPNKRPADNLCATGVAASNTGLVCAESTPHQTPDGVNTQATKTFTFDTFGQRKTMRTAKNNAEAKTGSYRYVYYGNSQRDLSGLVSAGGWLKAVVDPTGAYVAFAHDRAGNVARTWDRNATAGNGAPENFQTGTAGFTATLRGSGQDALSKPWRSVLSTTDPLGNTTSQAVDVNGNVTSVRPPRGNAKGDASHDTTMTVNAWGQPLTVTTPEERNRPTVLSYDAFGNPTRSTDPRGTLTTVDYDVVNRPTVTTFARGPYDAETAPPACYQSSADSPFGSGKLLCTSKLAYDTHDHPVVATDADGQRKHTVFDSVGRATVTVGSRRDLDPSETAQRFDPHVVTETVYSATVPVRTCNPRQYDAAEAGATTTCGADAVHAVHTSFDVADRASTTTTYRAAGQPLTREVRYDANGNPVRATDARSTTSTSTFDELDRLIAQTTPRAPGVDLTTAWHYDPVGNTTAIVRPGAAGDNIGLAGAGTDSRITGYSYDRNNRLVDTVGALQVAVVDPKSRSAGAEIAAATAAARTDEKAQTNLRTRVGYDADGNVTVRWNERAFAGATTDLGAPDDRFALRTTFDRNGRPSAQYAPRFDTGIGAIAGDLTDSAQQRAECPAGAPGYPANVGVCVTTLGYDPNGNISTVTLPDEASDASPRRLTYTYTLDNLVSEVLAPNPATDGTTVKAASFQHDGSGRVVRSTNAAGRTTVTSYLADGLASSVSGPAGPGGLAPRSRTVHNAAGQPVQTLTDRRTYSPDTSEPTGIKQTLVTATSYTADGLVAAVTTGGTDPSQPNGGGTITTRYGYDGNANPTEVFSPNASGPQPTGVEDPNPSDVPTRYSYTLDNLLAQTDQPVTVGSTGVLTSRTTRYDYDSAGRKTSVDVDTTGQPGEPQTFDYYPNDQLEATNGRADTGGGTIRRGYDATGQPTLLEQTLGQSTTTISSRFYLDGLLLSTDSDGKRTAFGYDGVGGRTARADGPADGELAVTTYSTGDAALPQAMADPSMGGQTSWSYNQLGQPTREALPSGQTQTFSYASDDSLTSTDISSSPERADQVAAGQAQPDLAHYGYLYDELGRVLAQEHYGKGAGTETTGTAAAPVTFRYTYDTAGRLSTFRDARGLRDLSYDNNANRVTYGKPGQVDPTSFTYRADDSIATRTSDGTTRTFSYDPYGGVRTDGCTDYAYDGFDRLASAAASSTGVLAPITGDGACPTGRTDYSYDALDRQTTRAVSTSATAPITGADSTSRMSYDGLSSRMWQRQDSGTTTGTFDYALDPAGQVKAITKQGAEPSLLAFDGHGNTALLTGPDKQVDCATRYDAYGSPDTNDATATSAPGTPCASGTPGDVDVFYRGERRDSGTGNYQLGARTYDPAKAGFLTPDVYRDEQPNANLGLGVDPLTRNSYAYVNGDPINYSDPTGHEPRANHDFDNPNACDNSKCSAQAQTREGGSSRAFWRELPKRQADARREAAGTRRPTGAPPARTNVHCSVTGCAFLYTGMPGPKPPKNFDYTNSWEGQLLGLPELEACRAKEDWNCLLFAAGVIPVGKVGKGGKEAFDQLTSFGDEAAEATAPWLRGTHGNAGRVPDSVRASLDGTAFKSWEEFRGEFWKAASADPALAGQFSKSNQRLMSQGLAPFVHSSQAHGGRMRYELHHVTPRSRGGDLYQLDNIVVVTPRYHADVLAPSYHYGGR